MRFRTATLAALTGAVCSCSEPLVITIALSPASIVLDAVGATREITATLTDQNGKPVPGVTVSWTSDNQAVVSVSPVGLVTAVGNGTTKVTASAGGSRTSAQVTVSQAPDRITQAGGDAQSGEVGKPLPNPVSVRVDDRLGAPVAGANVTFTVVGGGGSVGTPAATTGANGVASTTWTLGPQAGPGQSLQAVGGGQAVSFFATATAGPADSIGIVSGNNQAGLVGGALAESLVVRVTDRFGNPVGGALVTFSGSGGGTVSPTSAVSRLNGVAKARWTLANTSGPQTATATATVSRGSPVVFAATATAGLMSLHEGDGQTGLVGYGVNVRPAVRVVDSANQPLAGATITFAVTSGGGSVSNAVQVTGPDGIARVGRWTLGAGAGTNTVVATGTSGIGGGPITFTTTGVTAGFDIELRYLSSLTATQQAAFDSAAAQWKRLVFGDLPAVSLNAEAGKCGSNSPAVNETIDDLMIFVTVETIDGPGQTLASAGPCYIRSTSKLTILGRIRFDVDDLAQLESTSRMRDVVLHEMGHVLGIGPLWNTFSLLQNPSLPSNPGVDTHFTGPLAIAEFDALGGTSYTGGAKVPVENTQGAAGTRDTHWRESVFDHELMTGFVEAAGIPNPLSRVSVASLWDLGYTVNLDGADPYTHVFTAPRHAAGAGRSKLWLGDDVERGPIVVVDEAGRVTRVILY